MGTEVRLKRVLATTLVSLFFGLLLAIPAVADARLPGVLIDGNGTVFQVRPRTIGYTGDGTGYLGGKKSKPGYEYRGSIDWKKWNRHKAFGHARAWVNNCRPDCAAGHFHPLKAKVTLLRVRHGRFTRMYIRTKHYVDRRILTRRGTYWEWGICGTRYTRHC